MAEWMTRKLIQEWGLQDSVQVLSAGISAWEGTPISRGAKEALSRRQVEGHQGHTATQMNKTLLETADLVLTLAESHRIFLLENYPEYHAKIYNFLQYAIGQTADVRDPFGGDSEVYEQTAQQIERACQALAQRISRDLGKD